MTDKKQLRTGIKQQRSTLTAEQQKTAADDVLQRILGTNLLRGSSRVACYLPNGGELSPLPIIHKAWELEINCWLPMLDGTGENRLQFAPYKQDTDLQDNRYGIPEPTHEAHQLCPAALLDLVFVPLVAFDSRGNRLGMGKGYYDRTFEFLLNKNRPARPKLVGLAHSFQQVGSLEPAPWDVPLDAVVTEQRIFKFSS